MLSEMQPDVFPDLELDRLTWKVPEAAAHPNVDAVWRMKREIALRPL